MKKRSNAVEKDHKMCATGANPVTETRKLDKRRVRVRGANQLKRTGKLDEQRPKKPLDNHQKICVSRRLPSFSYRWRWPMHRVSPLTWTWHCLPLFNFFCHRNQGVTACLPESPLRFGPVGVFDACLTVLSLHVGC